MAGSPNLSMPSKTCLILNLGSHEPLYKIRDNYYVPLRLHEPEAALARRELGVTELGLWYSTRAAWHSGKFEKLHFPISVCSILYVLDVLEHRNEPIDLVLIVTGGETKGACEEHAGERDDTWYSGQLLRNFAETDALLKGHIGSVFVVPLGKNPHLYSQAQQAIFDNQFFSELLPKYEAIFVSQSPGLPMANAAVLRRALRANRKGVTAFQVENPGSDRVRSGAHSEKVVPVPTFDLLYDWAFDLIEQFIDRFDYEGAIAILQELTSAVDPALTDRVRDISTALRDAQSRWRLDMQALGYIKSDVKTFANKLWLACDVIEAQVQRRDDEDVLCRAVDIANIVRDAAAAFMANRPELVLDKHKANSKTMSDLRDRKNWGVCGAWRDLLLQQDDFWQPFREARNNYVHHFVLPGLNAACGTAKISESDIPSRLRGLIRSFCRNLSPPVGLETQPTFKHLNANVKALLKR